MVAAVLGGTAIERAGLTGFVSSKFDPFLNHLFADATVSPRRVADALEGRPAFVWLGEKPPPHEIGAAEAEGLKFVEMHGMNAATAQPLAPAQINPEIVEVRTPTELRAWHEIYCEVFGVDKGGLQDWQAVHAALGPTGDNTFLLLLAHLDGSPAATGSVYFEPSHAAARARGVDRALLQATASGAPVYTKAGYQQERTLALLISGEDTINRH